MLNANQLIGTHDVLFVTLDTLRFDVAVDALESGLTPCLKQLLPGQRWEQRHSPGSFTYAAHSAFFAGFLPTPISPGPHPRLFAAQFPGSETTSSETCVFGTPDIVSGLAERGYHTVCIGGVGFFNKRSPLGNVLPSLFEESYWSPELGVTNAASAANQIDLATSVIARTERTRRLFLFINISALHQPNCFYVPGATEDSCLTQRAALAYVDSCLPPLFQALRQRGSCLCILCSDHGTAYGEDGYQGHRLAHPVVWNVPYAEFVMSTDQTDKVLHAR